MYLTTKMRRRQNVFRYPRFVNKASFRLQNGVRPAYNFVFSADAGKTHQATSEPRGSFFLPS
jgi:hypothetical protein